MVMIIITVLINKAIKSDTNILVANAMGSNVSKINNVFCKIFECIKKFFSSLVIKIIYISV